MLMSEVGESWGRGFTVVPECKRVSGSGIPLSVLRDPRPQFRTPRAIPSPGLAHLKPTEGPFDLPQFYLM